MMSFTIINTSVVVMANGHNPTILHPSFLKTQQIVPFSDDELREVICTPAFSTVKYTNGISFLVDGPKFQLTDNYNDDYPHKKLEDSKVAEYACNYIAQLPHVKYRAVGVNFLIFKENCNPEKEILVRFLREGTWNDDNLKAEALGLKFVYSVENTKLGISVDSSIIKRKDIDLKGILINANYHTELSEEQKSSEAIEAIKLYKQRCDHFTLTIKKIIPENGS